MYQIQLGCRTTPNLERVSKCKSNQKEVPGKGVWGDAPWLVGREEGQSALFCSKRLALARGQTVDTLDGRLQG